MADGPTLKPIERRMLRVLRMVHELHKRGYQRIRVVPGLSLTNMHWHCHVTHVGNISAEHGAAHINPEESARYSDSQDNRYFGWADAPRDHAHELADKFIERFPEISQRGHGEDWAYAGWFVLMLGFAERGEFPVAFDGDDGYACSTSRFLPTTSGDHTGLPMPPPGEASR